MMTPDQVEATLTDVTSRLTLLDQWVAAQKAGQNTILAFMCPHSQLYFPFDFLKRWGHEYGIGLGTLPSSEVLDSDYDTAPPKVDETTKSIDQIMHPVKHIFAPVQLVHVTQADYDANTAVLMKDDPDMTIRAAIIRAKQLVNPRGQRVALLQASFKQQRGLL